MNKNYREKVLEELKMYNMSFKACILGYDSYFMGKYILCKRKVDYYSNKPSFINKLIGGGEQVAYEKNRAKIRVSVWSGFYWIWYQDIPLWKHCRKLQGQNW